MAYGEKTSTKLRYLGQSLFQILHPIIRTNLPILSQKIPFLLSWHQNEEQQTLEKHISYFLQNANIVHSECPPISFKDFDLKLVNATDIFLGCYFLEPIGIFCLHSLQKHQHAVFFHRPFSFFKNWAIFSLLEDSALARRKLCCTSSSPQRTLAWTWALSLALHFLLIRPHGKSGWYCWSWSDHHWATSLVSKATAPPSPTLPPLHL